MRENLSFPVLDGIPRLVRLDRAERLDAVARAYSAAWRTDGWGSPNPDYLRSLPYRDTTGRRSREWKVKKRSFDALAPVVAGREGHKVLDLGCGMGW
ncbi:MAG: hypothetical protein ACT4OI_00940, partial [Methanobacteriota archaeon]